MECDRSILDITHSFLSVEVVPKANEIDSNSNALFHALQSLGKLNLLALRVPRQWSGKEVSEETYNSFQELIARYSGALAFLQTQHQSAASILVASTNTTLQQEYLPHMGNGKILVGVGFSQLRRQGEPLTIALPVTGGYQLSGVVPWITGWGLFADFIVAATLPDGSAVFGIIPFKETHQASIGEITFTTPAELAAMTSTNTVSATLTRWFLPTERVISIKPLNWIHENDKNNVLRATFLATGCAMSGLDIIKAAAESKAQPFISNAYSSLSQELADCRNAIRRSQKQSKDITEHLHLRAWAIDLATRIAHAAVTVSSGAANYIHHPAQRVYREALVFTVTGQTTAVMEATLERLTHRWGEGEMGDKGDRGDNSCTDAINRVSTLDYSRVIHLSHVIDADIPQWQGDPPVKFATVAELEKDGYYLRRFSLGEHSATHINAPKSFNSRGVGIDEYPAESLIVPAILIDIRRQTAVNPDYVLTMADILAWEEEYGEMTADSIVLLYTGWQEKWQDNQAFFNQDAQGKLHFPGFGVDATQFLLDERSSCGVGIDTHGVDSGQDTTFAINSLVLAKPRLVLENLTNLDQLPPRGAMLAIAPLLLRGGSGSPVGVLALLP